MQDRTRDGLAMQRNLAYVCHSMCVCVLQRQSRRGPLKMMYSKDGVAGEAQDDGGDDTERDTNTTEHRAGLHGIPNRAQQTPSRRHDLGSASNERTMLWLLGTTVRAELLRFRHTRGSR